MPMKSINTVPIIVLLVLIVLFTLIAYAAPHTPVYDWLGFSEPTAHKDEPLASGIIVYIRDLPREKTPWDWLELLIVPAALAAIGLWFSQAQRQHNSELARKREAAEERALESRAQESALQGYLDRMTTLLLDRSLGGATASEGVREIARARTLTILRRLDEERVRYVVAFLLDTGLIRYDCPILSLQDADLRNALLNDVQLPEASFSGALLSEANLSSSDLTNSLFAGAMLNKAKLSSAKLQNATFAGANLVKAELRHADLRGANMQKANLEDANLLRANLRNATLNGANLKNANLDQAILTEVSYDEATVWPDGFDPPHQIETAKEAGPE